MADPDDLGPVEDQLRATAARRVRDYTRSADLPRRIDSRVHQRRRQRQLAATAGALSTGLAAVVAVGMLAVRPPYLSRGP